MSGKSKAWSDTQLWKQLKQNAAKRSEAHEAAKEFLPQIQLWMKKIEKVLSKGHTDPQDFTLHDDGHSFRVAERMMAIMRRTQWKSLSDYEIALLLLAAYLHDIGMNPERKKVGAIHQYLLTKGKGLLTVAEVAELQRWLDESGWELEPPICKAAPVPTDLDLADEITTYYVRHKHNDWSKEWIEKNLAGSMHDLSDWQEVLIQLCQSHHWDHHRLRQDDFEPRRIGNQHPQRLHLRHLACLLRVADILENDPERVPKVVFHHRNIGSRPKSIIHWEAPHQLNLTVRDDRVLLSALPLQARFHKAILSLADAVDVELAGCAAIAESQPFGHCSGLPDVKRDWFLAPACSREIRPKEGLYEYIDGAFRPNTSKLLQLLSGTQLYDSPFAAVRELLQNAFDTVREKIARRRLKQDDPADPSWEQRLGQDERVTLTLSNYPDGTLHLSCQDTGCGMTKDIIQNHVLISGDGRRPALIDLERQCEKAGFPLGRTGQFGIGVLSYFMMAKDVRITSCRLQDCGDLDAPGWTFTTSGVGDFGELRKLITQPPTGTGTLIEWTLDDKKFPNGMKLAQELGRYLRQQLIRIPCAFRLQADFDKQKTILRDIRPGWVWSLEDIRTAVSHDWGKGDKFLKEWKATDTAGQISEREEFWKRVPAWLLEAHKILHLEERIVPLPENAGLMRVVLPWFDFTEGPALAYIFRDREINGRTFGPTRILFAKGIRDCAWKGISSKVSVRDDTKDTGGAMFTNHERALGWIECDFTNLPRNQLQVSRTSLFVHSTVAKMCRDTAAILLGQMADDLQSRGPQPPFFGMFTDAILERDIRVQNGGGWTSATLPYPTFSAISLPCVALSPDRRIVGTAIFGGKQVSVLSTEAITGGYVGELRQYGRPTRVIGDLRRKVGISNMTLPAWLWAPSDPIPLDDTSVPFPPDWSDVWAVMPPAGRSLQNPVHWAVKLVPQDMIKYVRAIHRNSSIDWNEAANICDPATAVITLMKASISLAEPDWQNIRSHYPQLLSALWQICAEAACQPVQRLKLVCFDGFFWHCLASDFYHKTVDQSQIDSFLVHLSDPEWVLEGVEEMRAGESAW